MALPLSNSFETGLADETAITTANSDDGSAGNAWDAVDFGAGSGVYDTARAAHGTLSARLTEASPAANCLLRWGTASIGTPAQVWGRAYLYLTAYATGNQWAVEFSSNVPDRSGLIYIGNDGSWFVFDGTLGVSGGGALDFPLNQWIRIEWHLTANVATGSLEAKLFLYDSTTQYDIASFTNGNTRANCGQVEFGDLSGGTASFVSWWDDIQMNATGYPGPASPTPTAADNPPIGILGRGAGW